MRFEDEHGEFKQCRWCKGREDCFLPQDHACILYEFDVIARNRCIKEDTRERERERIIAELDRKARNEKKGNEAQLNEKKGKKKTGKERKPPVRRLQIIEGKWCYVYPVVTTSHEKLTFILETIDRGWVVFPDGEKDQLNICRDEDNNRIYMYGKQKYEIRLTSESLKRSCAFIFDFKKFIDKHSLHF